MHSWSKWVLFRSLRVARSLSLAGVHGIVLHSLLEVLLDKRIVHEWLLKILAQKRKFKENTKTRGRTKESSPIEVEEVVVEPPMKPARKMGT